MDSYVQAIGEIVEASEKVYLGRYGLSAKSNVVLAISTVSSRINELSNEEKVRMNEEVGKQIVLLSYLVFRLKYYHTKRLDFSMIPGMREVAEIALLFTERENVNSKNLRLVNKIVVALSKVDEVSMKARFGLGYRCLRLFMLLVLHGSFTNASIVATFILEQIEVV